MTNTDRRAILKSLGRNLKPSSAENYEKQIYRMCVRIVKCNKTEALDVDIVYRKLAYEKVGQIMLCDGRPERELILADIKGCVTGFNTQPYREFSRKQTEECSVDAHGPKVEKGEFPCRNPKCKSKECYFYQSQTSRCDEGYTTFVTCIKCKTRYKFR